MNFALSLAAGRYVFNGSPLGFVEENVIRIGLAVNPKS